MAATTTPAKQATKQKLKNRLEQLFVEHPDMTPAEASKQVPGIPMSSVYNLRSQLLQAGRCNRLPGRTNASKNGSGKGPSGKKRRTKRKGMLPVAPQELAEIQQVVPEQMEGFDIMLSMMDPTAQLQLATEQRYSSAFSQLFAMLEDEVKARLQMLSRFRALVDTLK